MTGHTPSQAGRIVSRFNNRLILIDTGMLSTYFKSGRASALELQNGRITAIYTDSRTPIVPPAAAYLRRDALPRRLCIRRRPSAAVAAADVASAASRY